MRFTRSLRVSRRGVTPGRLVAARRALHLQNEEVALFPELQTQETAAQRIARFDDAAASHMQQIRNHTAATWRRSRAVFRRMTPPQREAVLKRWHSPHWHPPLEAHYFADLVFGILKGD